MISVRNHNQTISNIINELKREAFRDGVNPDQIKDVVRESVKGLDKKEIEAVLDSLELHMKSTGDVRFRDVFGVPKQDLLAQLIAEARGPGGNAALGFFSAHDDFSAKAAVETANEAIRKIHSRLTEELRTEDAISNLALRDDGSVAIVTLPHSAFDDDQIKAAAERLLKEAGYTPSSLEIIRPAIMPMFPLAGAKAAVETANEAIRKIHSRLTEELRTEDAISNLALRDDGSVAIVTLPHSAFDDDQIKAAAERLLKEAGYTPSSLEIIRPAIMPMPPGGGPTSAVDPATEPAPGDLDTRFEKGIEMLNSSKPNSGPLADVLDFFFSTAELAPVICARTRFEDDHMLQAARKGIEEAVAKLLESKGFDDLVDRNYLGNTILVTPSHGGHGL